MKTKNYIVSKKYVIYAKNTHTNTKKKSANDKKYQKVRDNFHYTGKCREASHNNSNLRYKTSKEIRVVFHNGSTDDYHFIIKGLAEKFEGQFECLGKKIEIYMTFSVSIKKELDNGKTITYKRKFIDSFRFMSSSLSNLVDNLSEGLHNDKCTDYKSFLDYMIGKGEK